MRKEKWFLGALILILLALVFLKPPVGWQVRDILVDGFWEDSSSNGENPLVLENEILKAELVKLQNIKEQLGEWSSEYVPAMVYTRYPFNVKNEFLVSAGRDQGIRVGQAVILSEGVLIGRVEQVFKNTGLVRTIFDNQWRLSVRIGKDGAEGLLVGGGEPKVTLISKEINVQLKDVVYSVDPGFPYGLVLGEVIDVGLTKDQLFQEIKLGVGYDLGRARMVLILRE